MNSQFLLPIQHIFAYMTVVFCSKTALRWFYPVSYSADDVVSAYFWLGESSSCLMNPPIERPRMPCQWRGLVCFLFGTLRLLKNERMLIWIDDCEPSTNIYFSTYSSYSRAQYRAFIHRVLTYCIDEIFLAQVKRTPFISVSAILPSVAWFSDGWLQHGRMMWTCEHTFFGVTTRRPGLQREACSKRCSWINLHK